MTETPEKITIDGVDYNPAMLSERAKTELLNLQLVDKKIAEAQQTLAILQTARGAYAKALKAALPAQEKIRF